MGRRYMVLKDDALADLAGRRNVAQFVSFDARCPPRVRHAVVAGHLDVAGLGTRRAVEVLLDGSNARSLNVRTFDPHGERRSTPFTYGLTDVDEVLEAVRAAAADGLYSIVNETIDVHDGGVSGVSMPGVVEYAPDVTPRAVEEPGVLSASTELAIGVLRTVYGDDATDVVVPGSRLEFSVHPMPVGTAQGRVTSWEIGPAHEPLTTTVRWPNRFSRFLGDKAFGLVIADLLGLRVPFTTVLARRIAPFSFGRRTGSGRSWLRTAPDVPEAGKFPTSPGWTDPFRLLAELGDERDRIASVLWQEGVAARWSGSTGFWSNGPIRVEGVPGAGDAFMLGRVPPVPLPDEVVAGVVGVVEALRPELGPCSIEWAHDGADVWVLQLHQESPEPERPVPAPRAWLDYDPVDGLETLRSLVVTARDSGAGIRLMRPVGVTSHVGEILRRSGLPVAYP